MKKIVLSSLLLTTLTLTAQAAVAADQVKLKADIEASKAKKSEAEANLKALQAQLPPNEQIMTTLRLGYVNVSGNSETETFSLYADAKKAWDKHNVSLVLDSQYGTSDNEENVNKVFVEGNYGYSFIPTLSATLVIGYKTDKFSSYDYQSYVGPGLKWITYTSARQELNLEGSILYSMDQVDEDLVSNSSLEENYASYRAKLLYKLNILDNLKFDQELSYRASFDESENYFVFSRSALSSKISDIFSAGISYKIDYSNIVAPNLETTDKTLEAFVSIDY
jgi:putative salt-induced outer membrane protein YdiY